jgi:predicted dehydrogenase
MVSQYHLRAWAGLTGRAEVVAIYDPDRGRAVLRQQEFNIAAAYADPEAMLEQETIDALDIASPRQTHVAWIDAAIARGVDVLCQKPIAPTLAEAEAVIARAGTQIRVMAHENWRFRPWYRDLAKLVTTGALGDLLEASISMVSSGLIPDQDGRSPALERQPFMAHERRLMIAEVLVHHLDVMRFLCGPLAVVDARSRHVSPNAVGETLSTILLETPAGAPIVVRGTMAAGGHPTATRDRLEFTGSKASAVIDGCDLHILSDKPSHRHYPLAQAYQQSFDDTIGHFVECIGSGAPFETDAVDNLETLRLVERAYALADRADATACGGRR